MTADLNKLKELYEKDHELSSKIIAERHTKTKENLMKERALIRKEITSLEAIKEAQTEKEAMKTLENLATENRLLI